MPSLFQSGAWQVNLLMSKVATPFFFYHALYNLFELLECFFQIFIPNKVCVLFDKLSK